ncbi:MAG: PqqD family protein [Actinomycetota bacterium]|nr:PqqD family protein [Actinomycetota bacterium]
MNYRIPDAVLRANLDTEEVLLNTDTGQYHLLNDTGRRIVNALEAGESAEAASVEVAVSTGMTRDVVQADVEAFVEACVARGLLRSEE